jgi:hypothetical protein
MRNVVLFSLALAIAPVSSLSMAAESLAAKLGSGP